MTNTLSDTPAPSSPYDVAEASARQSAKWALGVLGAIGTALLVGVSLKNLAGLHGHALDYAALGVGISIVGIGISVAAVLWIQTPIYASFYTLATTTSYVRQVRKDPAILDGQFSDVAELRSEYDKLLKEWKEATPKEEAQIKDAVTSVRTLAEAVTADGHFYIFMRRFKRCVALVFIGALAAAAGAVVFVANANSSPSSLAQPTPVPVNIVLSSSAKAEFAPLLGANCVKSEIRAIAISGTPSALSVVTVSTPRNRCASEFLTITPRVGTVVDSRPVIPDKHHRWVWSRRH
jgi:hypothetical protein